MHVNFSAVPSIIVVHLEQPNGQLAQTPLNTANPEEQLVHITEVLPTLRVQSKQLVRLAGHAEQVVTRAPAV